MFLEPVVAEERWAQVTVAHCELVSLRQVVSNDANED